MSGVLQALAFVFGLGAAGFAMMALVEGYRAVRIGGSRLLFNGLDWFVMSDRVPPEAQPHMRRALARWGLAMLCMVLGGIAGALSAAAA